MNVCATITKVNSTEIRTAYVRVNESEKTEFAYIVGTLECRGFLISTLEIEEIPFDAKSFGVEDFEAFVEGLTLHKKVPFLADTKTKVVDLPKPITYKDGKLLVDVGKVFSGMQHDDCVHEIELVQWILRTFPQSHYANSRAIFALAEPGVKYRTELVECDDVHFDALVSYRYEFDKETNKLVELRCIYEERDVAV